jgi:hypothetical protein
MDEEILEAGVTGANSTLIEAGFLYELWYCV